MFLPGDRDLHFSRDGLRHIALQSQDISQVAVVSFRPEVLVGGGTNQLCVDANPAAFWYDRSFHNGIHSERSGNFWQ